jgi:hypothetical protein
MAEATGSIPVGSTDVKVLGIGDSTADEVPRSGSRAAFLVLTCGRNQAQASELSLHRILGLGRLTLKLNRLIVAGLIAGLVAGSAAVPAQAGKKKKAKPVATTLFMDGTSNYGEEDQTANSVYLKLAATEGTGEKSMGIPNYAGGPNTNCAGNSLMPVFVGQLSGRVTGDMKVSFTAMSTPAQVEIRVWPDVAAQACNEAYIEPAASVVVDLPSGEGAVEAVLEDVDFTASSLMMIQVTPVIGGAPSYSRMFYGTADSKVEFTCTPASGKSC